MSFPNIPDVSPDIDITTNEAVNLLLASIAFEELGLSHVINAEAEKIQSVLGTLNGQVPRNPSIDDLVRINAAVERVLRDVVGQELLLQFKLQDVLGIIASLTTTTSTTTTTTTSTTTTSTTTTRTTTTTTTTTTTSTTTTRSTTTRCWDNIQIG